MLGKLATLPQTWLVGGEVDDAHSDVADAGDGGDGEVSAPGGGVDRGDQQGHGHVEPGGVGGELRSGGEALRPWPSKFLENFWSSERNETFGYQMLNVSTSSQTKTLLM